MAIVAISVSAFFLASNLENNIAFRNFVESAGIFGVILVAFICGLDAFVPIPPATFAPLFLEAGFSHTLVIFGFVVGTLMADSVGYLLGWYGRDYTHSSFPRLTKKLHEFLKQHSHLVQPVIWLYAALAPLPNEILLIPLALSGYSYKKLILPLIIGSIFHHSVMVFGYQNLFKLFF